MTAFQPQWQFDHLGRLQVIHIEAINAAGSSLLHLCTDIELGQPHYFTHDTVLTQVNSPDAPAAVTLCPVPEVIGEKVYTRCQMLTSHWAAGSSFTGQPVHSVIVLAPLGSDLSVLQQAFAGAEQLQHFNEPMACLSAVDNWLAEAKPDAVMAWVCLDSQLNYAEFAHWQSALFHDNNPDGQIPSEGITVLYAKAGAAGTQPVWAHDEPFYRQASSEATQVLGQLLALHQHTSQPLVSNHGHDSNSRYELYRGQQSISVAAADDSDEPLAITAIQAEGERQIIALRTSLGDSGFNELGLLIALAASRTQWAAANGHGLIWFHHQTRLFWPNVYPRITDQGTYHE